MTRWPRLALAALALLATGLACRDAVGPGAHAVRAASLNIAAPIADLIAPDGSRLEVDNGIVRITRADGTVALERSFDFPAGQQSVQVELEIPLSAPTEQFTAGIQLRNGQTLLFQTSGPITVSFGNGNPSPQLPAPTYAGPGAAVTGLTLAPRDTVLTFGDAVRFRSTAVAGQAPVQAYFINLTTSDPQVVVGTNGAITAPSRRATITVRATVLGTSVADQTTLTFVPRPTQLTRTSGDAQTATVGTALPQPLRVTVTAADGLGVANVPVTFATTATGASVSPTTVRTDANGVASTTATLGSTAGAQSFTATVAGLPAATFTQTATAGAFAALVYTAAPPATVRAAAPFNVTVEGRDALGNATALPSPVTIAFGSRPGSATLTGTVSVTPTGSTAVFTGLQASRPGAGGTLVATAGAQSVTSAPFAVTVGPLAAVQLAAGSVPSNSPVGTTLPDSLVWRAADDLGVPVGGLTMTFTLSGQVGSLRRSSAVTDTGGLASPGPWTLATTAGANAITPAIGVVQGAGIFVTGTAGAPASVARDTGDAQTAVVNNAVATAPRVRVTDAGGNPVAGVTVTFAVASGGGAVTGATPVTDATGRASVGSWTLGALAGANTLTATVAALPPVTFTATGTPGAPTVMEIVAPVGGSQAGSTGQPVATAPSVRLRDAQNNPAPGITVTFAVINGGGSVTGTTPATDANGIATVGSWTLGAVVGTNTLRATAGALTRDFTATTATLVVSQLVITQGATQSVRVGRPFLIPIVVQAQTAGGVPVPGVQVFYSITAPDSTTLVGTGGFLTTDANGNLTVPPEVISTEPGFYNMGFAVVGASGTSAQISVTGEAVSLATTQSAALTVAAGAPLPAALAVLASDARGSLVADAPVTFTRSAANATGPFGSITGTVVTRRTTQLGYALVGGNAPTIPGRYLYRASVDGGTPVGFVVNVTGTAVGTDRQLTIVAGDGQRAAAGTAVTAPMQVRLTDALGGVVAGAVVTFTPSDPLGFVGTPVSVTTDASGLATLPPPFALSSTPGVSLIVASSDNAAPVTLAASGWGAVAAMSRLAPVTYGPQPVGTTAAQSPIVRVVDANGIPVAGVVVIVTNAQPNATGQPVTLPVRQSTTNAAGEATLSFPIGANPGRNTMTFAFGSLVVVFTADGVQP